MINLTIEIDNYGDFCGKCKQMMCIDPRSKGELSYFCCVFKKMIPRTLGGRRLARVNACMKLDKKEGAE